MEGRLAPVVGLIVPSRAQLLWLSAVLPAVTALSLCYKPVKQALHFQGSKGRALGPIQAIRGLPDREQEMDTHLPGGPQMLARDSWQTPLPQQTFFSFKKGTYL